VSTVTLVIDLTWVSDSIMGDEEELDNVRSSRTAKIGARAGRIVRVLRLVRILKLYKAVYEARQVKKRLEKAKFSPGDDDNWDDIRVDKTMIKKGRESRVGKKLAELTIRRVVCLVLVMILVLPMLRIDAVTQFPSSATFGADSVNSAFKLMQADFNNATKTSYHKAMLQYIYYHNWYSRAEGCPVDSLCPKHYDSSIFWIGIQTAQTDSSILRDLVEAARLDEASVRSWEQDMVLQSANWMYDIGTMPAQVQTILGSNWTASCDTNSKKYKRLGFSVLQERYSDGENNVGHTVKCPEDLRITERKKYAPHLKIDADAFDEWHFAFYFDQRPFSRSESIFSLLTVAFVCVALCVSSLFFSNDANTLVLYPVENMISKVETIRDNPLMAMKMADEEFKMEELNRAMLKRAQSMRESRKWSKWFAFVNHFFKKTPPSNEIMETVILEKTIIKLGSLLALGFGEAGANIIEHNIGQNSAGVNAMLEGTRVECILGVARIQDFSVATEVLQAKVMTFVNQVAEIVHGVVDEFHGAANKNSGDTFLMIWRIRNDEELASKMADMSMLAFTRILGAVHRSGVLAAYRGHPGLQQRLGKNCRVNLSSSLHYGWAIEGAVGSEFKIDASYLSPNVSIADSIERATDIYGVSILLAESVLKVCTPAVASKCRLIDRVIITGSTSPMDLYVIDLDHLTLTVEPPPPVKINWTSRQRFRVRQFLEKEKTQKLHEDVCMIDYFNEHPDIVTMRFRYTIEFLNLFNMGYQNYAQGEWQVAQRLLSRTKSMLGVEDGPSNALLRYMETFSFSAPESWQGIRELTFY